MSLMISTSNLYNTAFQVLFKPGHCGRRRSHCLQNHELRSSPDQVTGVHMYHGL